MPWLPRPKKDDPISFQWGCAVVDAINELLRGPKVVAPLARVNGHIYLAQDFDIYTAKTTEEIPARASTQWGHGQGNILTLSEGGVESVAPGFAAVTLWNMIGNKIPSGVRVWVRWKHARWCIIQVDCSGVI